MFERYTDAARRSLFYARSEASQAGSTFIEPVHLVLALVQEVGQLISRLLPTVTASEAFSRDIRETLPAAKRTVSLNSEIPLSPALKRALSYAAEDAEDLGHRHIGPEHLLLGVLRAPSTPLEEIFARYGIDHNRVWSEIGGVPTSPRTTTAGRNEAGFWTARLAVHDVEGQQDRRLVQVYLSYTDVAYLSVALGIAQRKCAEATGDNNEISAATRAYDHLRNLFSRALEGSGSDSVSTSDLIKRLEHLLG
jgi:ATP-dependent Clp protease ATP-binding subunit ClpA